MNKLIWIEINKNNLLHNVRQIRKLAGKKVLIAPAIKANAYGHGLIEVAKIFEQSEADYLSVNSIAEAELIKKNKIKKPIIVIGYTQLSELEKVVNLGLQQTVYSLETVRKLDKIGKRKNKRVKIHLKIDTGMSRQGIMPDQLIEFVTQVKKLKNIKLEGLATHFANSDEPESPAYYKKQQRTMEGAVKELEDNNMSIPIVHASNSAASMLTQKMYYNLVRPGIMIYGLWPSEQVAKVWTKKRLTIKPVLTLKTKVAQVKEIPKGAAVSYGLTFVAKKRTKVAVLPIGYYDGVDRKLSNQGEVLVGGKRCPILGRVCMNIMVVDISKAKNVKPEDEVVLIGKQGKEEITVDEIAKKLQTINYEVTTRLRESIDKYVV